MSLALVQGYSSSEDEEQEPQHGLHYHNSSSSSEDDGDESKPAASSSILEPSRPTSSNASALPSASDVFFEISGRPAFLNNCVQEYAPQQARHASRHNKHRKDKKFDSTWVMRKQQVVL